MTPEQTLDWLAQQHFDQCREDRPVQHWIRKMKSELPEQEPMTQDEAPASPKDAALKLALEYIETNAHERRHVRWAIKEALAQPEKERYFCQRCGKPVNLTTIHTCTPPQENT